MLQCVNLILQKIIINVIPMEETGEITQQERIAKPDLLRMLERFAHGVDGAWETFFSFEMMRILPDQLTTSYVATFLEEVMTGKIDHRPLGLAVERREHGNSRGGDRFVAYVPRIPGYSKDADALIVTQME